MKRATPLLDNIDYKILTTIEKENYSVMDLCSKIEIAHISIKPHITRLILIKAIVYENGLIKKGIEFKKIKDLLNNLLLLTKIAIVDLRRKQ